MFSHAAMAAAPRRASIGAMDPPIVLSLDGASRSEPIIVGDGVEDGPPPLPDLSMSSAPLVRDVLPPAVSATSEQGALRGNLLEVVRSTFGASSASSTIRTYEAILRGIVPKVALKLGSAVLPMRTEAQFFSFFGAVPMIGPKSASPVTLQHGGKMELRQVGQGGARLLARSQRRTGDL